MHQSVFVPAFLTIAILYFCCTANNLYLNFSSFSIQRFQNKRIALNSSPNLRLKYICFVRSRDRKVILRVTTTLTEIFVIILHNLQLEIFRTTLAIFLSFSNYNKLKGLKVTKEVQMADAWWSIGSVVVRLNGQ